MWLSFRVPLSTYYKRLLYFFVRFFCNEIWDWGPVSPDLTLLKESQSAASEDEGEGEGFFTVQNLIYVLCFSLIDHVYHDKKCFLLCVLTKGNRRTFELMWKVWIIRCSCAVRASVTFSILSAAREEWALWHKCLTWPSHTSEGRHKSYMHPNHTLPHHQAGWAIATLLWKISAHSEFLEIYHSLSPSVFLMDPDTLPRPSTAWLTVYFIHCQGSPNNCEILHLCWDFIFLFPGHVGRGVEVLSPCSKGDF